MHPSAKVSARMARKVNLARMGTPGEYPDLHEKLALELAVAYQAKEDPDYVSVSWANQVKAQEYFNAHGFVDTLNHLCELRNGGR